MGEGSTFLAFMEPLWISVKLSLVTTVILFIIALPTAYYLAHTRSRLKPILEAVTALPIVLPPSVLGFYLLVALSESSPIGRFFAETFDVHLVFSFEGLVVASCFYSFPFMVQPLQAGFEGLNRSIIEAAYTLGKSRLQTLFSVMLPNMFPSILTATIITFAHTMGEFGVVLMVGGSREGVTRVASIAIYEEVESLEWATAHVYSLILVTISFLVLLSVYLINRKSVVKVMK